MKIFETAKGSEMVLPLRRFTLKFEVQGRMTQRERRALLLSIFRKVSELLEIMDLSDSIYEEVDAVYEPGWIAHRDGSWENAFRDLRRGIALRQSLEVRSGLQKLGYEIRMRRLNLRLSQAQLSMAAGLNRGHLSDIERGKTKARKSTVERVRAVLRAKTDKPTIDKEIATPFKHPKRRKIPVEASPPDWPPPPRLT